MRPVKESLEVDCGQCLVKKGFTLAVAESCTGGLLAHRLTNIPGSSRYFQTGIVAYDNRWKEKLLGVSHQVLEKYGAVSKEVAGEMARGICRFTEVDIGLSVTGIAGPGGGSELKPVGLVFMGIDFLGNLTIIKEQFSGNRKQIKEQAVQSSLTLLWQHLQEYT